MSLYMYTVSIHFKKPQNQVSTQAWKTETDKHQHKTDWTERLVLNMSKTLSKKKKERETLQHVETDGRKRQCPKSHEYILGRHLVQLRQRGGDVIGSKSD